MNVEEILAAAKVAQEMTGEQALAALVGDGKKYATAEDMAKGALNGQAHIEKLEAEAVGYKTDATKAKGVDELLAMINKQSTTTTDETSTDDQSDNTTFGVEQVNDMIAKALQSRDGASVDKQREANQKLVTDELIKKYGDKALDVYKALSAKHNTDLATLAGDSPSLVLQLIGSQTSGTQQTSLPASTNGTTLTGGNNGKLTKKAIATMYANGDIDRYQKIDMENDNYTLLGKDAFYS